MTESRQAALPTPSAPSRRSMYPVLIAVLIPLVLGGIDSMIVNTALPTIVSELGGLDLMTWVVVAYTLAMAATTPVWGKLGDMYGRKGIFMAAVVIFLLGSALSGMSQTMEQLIGFRAVQGIGAGGLMVGVFSIIAELIPARERGTYQGLISAVFSSATLGGPLVGGAVTEYLGWRWGFYINLPLGAISLLMIATMVKLPKRRSEARIDYAGSVLLATGIVSLVLVTSWGGTRYSWGSAPVLGLIALGVVAFVVFVFVERRAAEPVLPPAVFRDANFALISVIGLLMGVVMLGAPTFLPMFMQAVQGASVTNSGFLLAPLLLAMMATSAIAGRMTSKSGKYKGLIIAGAALVALANLLFSRMTTDTGSFLTAAIMVIQGAGIGILTQTTMLVAQNSVRTKDLGVASATTTLARLGGGSVGVALMGALFASRMSESLAASGVSGQSGIKGEVSHEGAQLDVSGLAGLPEGTREAYEGAVASGIQQVFLLTAVVSIATLALTWFVKEVPLAEENDPAPAESEAQVERSAG
ncbi:MDR family MFS transporter [Streptomyces sp. 21So2-11]|uniref:MDR family MFS transporter n=1 Tax=Streptomyces sp. 21So2-11 TaxID=3144408 RepID=UPI0032194229